MIDRIITWGDRFGGRSLAAHAQIHPSSLGDRTLPAEGVADSPKAVARVNHGRWIADCPFPGCGGAEYVNLEERLFFCCECRNATVGHQPVSVVVSGAWKKIEALLLERPVPANRNWYPGETLADLKSEAAEGTD